MARRVCVLLYKRLTNSIDLMKQEQLHGGGRASRGKSARDIRGQSNFLQQMHNKKMFDLENEGQGHEVQGSQWSHSMQISISIQVILGHFSLAFTVFEIFTFKNSRPGSIDQGHDIQHL